MFMSEEEAIHHQELVAEYVEVLEHQVGIHVATTETRRIGNERTGRVVGYIAQEKLPIDSIGHRAIHSLPAREARHLVRSVLTECGKVFRFNAAHEDELEVGIDKVTREIVRQASDHMPAQVGLEQ